MGTLMFKQGGTFRAEGTWTGDDLSGALLEGALVHSGGRTPLICTIDDIATGAISVYLPPTVTAEIPVGTCDAELWVTKGADVSPTETFLIACEPRP